MKQWIVGISMLTGVVIAPGAPHANDAAAYLEAEAAIRGFRAQSFLRSPCEAAFDAFFGALRAGGPRGLVHLTPPFGQRRYFAYGNTDAEPMLDRAAAICREQAGRQAEMVLKVLYDRARAKERRIEQFRHAERAIGN